MEESMKRRLGEFFDFCKNRGDNNWVLRILSDDGAVIREFPPVTSTENFTIQ